VQKVEVAPGVALEVLDFGGAGPPLVFLAGFGNTGHVFDDLAPAFVDRHRVVAVTRRGFGASSWPEAGYDLATRVADDLAVLDALKLDRATLVGHSLAGDELTAMAVAHPQRVASLVYLDAAQDHSQVGALLESRPKVEEPQPPPEANKSLQAFAAFFDHMLGVHVPEGEVLATMKTAADGSVAGERVSADAQTKILSVLQPQDFASVRAPALVMIALQGQPSEAVPLFDRYDAQARAEYEAWWPRAEAFLKASSNEVHANLAGARFVDWQHTSHYLFLSRRDEVVREMRAFLDP
jgi:pimeloyl-ACP methyl ester carboxylesterase